MLSNFKNTQRLRKKKANAFGVKTNVGPQNRDTNASPFRNFREKMTALIVETPSLRTVMLIA